ncbi:MAG: hypothetical protein HOP09_14950 [Hyphomicrobium sp.]|nr:hypothetical protein [Hyphomicrobium sp.]
MQDFIYSLYALDRYTLTIAVCFVAVAFWLIHEIAGSTSLAVLSAPVLIAGALVTNYLFGEFYIIPTNDKDTNVVIACAVGVVLSMILILAVLAIHILISEARSSAAARCRFCRATARPAPFHPAQSENCQPAAVPAGILRGELPFCIAAATG